MKDNKNKNKNKNKNNFRKEKKYNESKYNSQKEVSVIKEGNIIQTEVNDNMEYIKGHLTIIVDKCKNIESNINQNHNKDVNKKDIYEKIQNIATSKESTIINKVVYKTKENLREVENCMARENNNNKKYICERIEENKSIIQSDILSMKNAVNHEFKILNNKVEENKLKRQLSELESNIESRFEKIESILKAINNTTEILEGKLKQLDDLAEIKTLLANISDNQNKINRKPANHEDEVILNLGEYGNKIIDELTSISSEYAKNREKIENIDKVEEEYAIKLNESKKKYEEKGKLSLVEEICERFSDLDKLYEENNNESIIIMTILKNNGFSKVEGLEKGNEVEINEENRSNMETKISFREIGKYRIIKSAFELNGVIKYKAEVEKI